MESLNQTTACVKTRKVVIILNNEEKNIQLQPVNKIFLPTDIISSGLFGVTDLKLEKVEGKKNLYIFSDSGLNVPIYLEPPSGEKLETSDFASYCVAVSEFIQGNNVFTLRRLWQKIGGSHTLTAEMKNFIAKSIDKLQYTKFSADLTAINEKFKYEGKKVFKSYLLPLKSIETRVNGNITDAVFQFIDTPPLLEISQDRKQFFLHELKDFNVPALRITPKTLAIKTYLFYRVKTIVGSNNPHKKHFCGKGKDGKFKFRTAKKLPPIIVLDTLYEKCGLSESTKWQRQDTRAAIKKVMEHFKAQGLITDWYFEKKNGAFYSIEFV